MFVRMLSDKCSYFDFKKKLDNILLMLCVRSANFALIYQLLQNFVPHFLFPSKSFVNTVLKIFILGLNWWHL